MRHHCSLQPARGDKANLSVKLPRGRTHWIVPLMDETNRGVRLPLLLYFHPLPRRTSDQQPVLVRARLVFPLSSADAHYPCPTSALALLSVPPLRTRSRRLWIAFVLERTSYPRIVRHADSFRSILPMIFAHGDLGAEASLQCPTMSSAEAARKYQEKSLITTLQHVCARGCGTYLSRSSYPEYAPLAWCY